MKKILVIFYVILQNIAAIAASPDTLKIQAHETRYLTHQYFLELEDPNNDFSIQDIISNSDFHSIPSSFPLLKYSKSITWLKFTVKNNTGQAILPLTIGKSVIDEFDLYFSNPANRTITHLSSKDPQYQSSLLTQSITLINLPIQADSAITCFVRVKSNAPTVIPIQVHSSDQFLQKRSIENMINGAILGMFIIMGLYNLMLFIIVGDINYFYYFVFITFLGSTQSLTMGYGSYLLPGNKILLNNYLIPAIRICFGYSLLLFVDEFLQLKQNIQHSYKYFRLLYIFFTLALLAMITGLPRIAYTIITLSMSATSIALLFLGFYLFYTKEFKPAKFFVIGWSLFLLSILISTARNTGLLPYNYFTLNVVLYTSIIELILFSAALADKINFYRQQNSLAQLGALTIAKENERLITEQNISLEHRVKSRTQELIEANENLSVTIDNLKSAQMQLIETEKMASLGQLTAGVAHEINNPINFVSSNVKPLRTDFDEIFNLLSKYEKAAKNPEKPELLQEANAYKQEIDADFVKAEIRTLLDGIHEGAARTTEIVQSLRTFSRMDELILQPANINTAILSALLILRSSIPYYIEIKPILGKLEPLNCYSGKIDQVLINLLNNSIHAIKAKAEYTDEKITIITRDNIDSITIEMEDTGIGMTEEVKLRIFEPFFSTKPVGEGSGLGLSIVFGIIEKHNGTIEVKSAPDKGTTFIITLPKNLQPEPVEE